MNEVLINKVASDNNITAKQVEAVLNMLSEGATVPFIARYRKEATGALKEDEIRKIEEVYKYEENLLNRKEDVIRLIDEKGLLTDLLKDKILKAEKLVDVEDLYRPFKEKKKTKASEAIKNGLEPLAKMIMSYPVKGNIEELCKKFINENVKDKDKAVEGAGYIIAEWISDNAFYRKSIRKHTYLNGLITTKLKKDGDKLDENKVYEMYYDFSEPVKEIKPHRILAINRGEKEKVLNVSIELEEDKIIDYLETRLKVNETNSYTKDIVINAIKDSYKRLIKGSIEREIRSDLTEKASIEAINNFSVNLEALLLTPPMKERVVLAFDPGYVNGCKLAVIDKTGKYLDSMVVKPFLNGNTEERIKDAKKIVANLIKKYNVDIISIGNGTASRESEKLCAEMISEYNLNCKYVIVSEAGASIYSASPLAKEEFPDLAIEKEVQYQLVEDYKIHYQNL